ncbi:SPFH domain-containing protein [Microlunatus sp. GCM10028923]|uniref:SPFH domain-containing protein n=1 Tax=Microlunatus sp. GCM10028923 TaxID=3273400 RepID=UPI003608145B
MDPISVILGIIVIGLVVVLLGSAIKVIRQQRVGVVERLGKFRRTLDPGPHLLIPALDKVRYNIDMRETVVPFPPQGVITEDNLMVSIDSVIYFQVIDPVRAAYEAQNYIQAIEQLTQTTLRNIIGGMDLERTLVSRDEINGRLRVVLDEATGKWGIKVNRVELRSIEPPPTIRDAMEKQTRAERDKRAAILTAEGQRQSQILSAGGEKESAILRAQGDREAAILRAQAERQSQMLKAEGEAQAITTVFNAIHAGQPDQALLSYQYLQMLPNIAKGDANKVWVIPAEIGKALEGLGGAVSSATSAIPSTVKGEFQPPEKVDVQAEIEHQNAIEAEKAAATVQKAIDEAQQLEKPVYRPATPSVGQSPGTPAIGTEPAAPAAEPPPAGSAPQFAPPAGQPEAETGNPPGK